MATIRLPTDFKEFLELLNSETVEYLLVGGYAVGFHGHPRATGDIDIWINPTATNAANVASALKRFGFSAASIDPLMFAQPKRVFQIGVPPIRIDVLTSVSGLEFETAFSERLEVVLDGVRVTIISLQNLKANKRASGRLKDLSDLENLA
jgi:hypothetical protein